MNVAYRWFLRYLMNEPIPHFSTISYNFKHRYTEQTIEEIFYWILKGDPKMTEKVKKDAKDLNNRRVLLITAILALIVMLTYTISLFVGGDFKAHSRRRRHRGSSWA